MRLFIIPHNLPLSVRFFHEKQHPPFHQHMHISELKKPNNPKRFVLRQFGHLPVTTEHEGTYPFAT
jgi:hypothetical protein